MVLSFIRHRPYILVMIILLQLLLRVTAQTVCSHEQKPRCATRLPKEATSSNPDAKSKELDLSVTGRSLAELTATSPISTFHMLVMDSPSTKHTKAIEHAAKLASAHWESSTPVRAKVSFHDDFGDPYILGDSRSTSAWFIGGYAYPVALTKAIIGQDLNLYDQGEDYFDVVVRLNNKTSFYTETDGATPWVDFDLVTVVLHEMFHGLLLTGGGIQVIRNFRGPGYLARFIDSSYQWRYEAFLAVKSKDGRDCSLTSYRGSYELLGNALTSNNLWFRSSKERVAALHAPADFDEGSSIYHLSEVMYGEEGTGNDLMTPSMPTYYSSHKIGPHVQKMQQLMRDENEKGAPVCQSASAPARITDDDLFLISIGIMPDEDEDEASPTPSATPTASPSISPKPVEVESASFVNASAPYATPTAAAA